MFYFNAYCIKYTFRIYILLHDKKHYFLDFCYLFLKSLKALSVSLILEQCLLHHLMLGKTGIIVVWEISKRKRCKLENFC